MFDREEWPEAEEPAAGPFRVTPGFVAFVGALVSPALLALGVYVGASLVADDVYAAEKVPTPATFGQPGASQPEAAAWKRALVGVCPLH